MGDFSSGKDSAFPGVQPAAMSRVEFVRIFGTVYEKSPWVAERAWDQGLTPAENSRQGLRITLAGIVDRAGRDAQLALLRSHPDLAEGLAERGQLSEDQPVNRPVPDSISVAPLNTPNSRRSMRVIPEHSASPIFWRCAGVTGSRFWKTFAVVSTITPRPNSPKPSGRSIALLRSGCSRSGRPRHPPEGHRSRLGVSLFQPRNAAANPYNRAEFL
ncbi:MAG: hypothetical protein CM1200mP20_16550 [Pseudomonadota bacterium]|nr:MAG: hypothetical protein CM1200mP20_16550 [Pseudomonadota bacterium]